MKLTRKRISKNIFFSLYVNYKHSHLKQSLLYFKVKSVARCLKILCSFFKFIFIVDTIVDVPIFYPWTSSPPAPAPFPLAITTLLPVSMDNTSMFFSQLCFILKKYLYYIKYYFVTYFAPN